MDYLDVPQSLIYRKRNNLNEFGVRNPASINGMLFSRLKEHFLKGVPGALDLALRCYNNAYYICTLIQMDDFPELRVADYEKKLFEEECDFKEDVCAASMGLVYELLPVYNSKYNHQSNDLTKTIFYRFSHFHWEHTRARFSFYSIANQPKTGNFTIPRNEFAPRDICEAIENVSIGDLAAGAEYICETLSKLDDNRKRMYGADLAIARLNDDYREKLKICKEDSKNGLSCSLPRNWDIPLNTAIHYIKEHYPTPKEKTSNQTDVNINTSSSQVDQPLQASTDTDQLLLLIDGLRNEKAHLEQELNTAEETIKKQRALIDDYAAKYDPKVLKGKEKQHILTGKQHVILALAILAYLKRIPNARTNLSYQLSFVAGRNESTMADYLKSAITQEECDETAKVFQAETPFIAKLIKELPDKLAQDKSEKNREKALKKNND